jgi:hypothetical protein
MLIFLFLLVMFVKNKYFNFTIGVNITILMSIIAISIIYMLIDKEYFYQDLLMVFFSILIIFKMIKSYNSIKKIF